MCVSAEVQSEMPDILRCVDSLRLRAQNGFGNGRVMLAVTRFDHDAVEESRHHGLAKVEARAQRFDKIRERMHAFGRRCIMHAEKQGHLARFKGFCRADIRGNHHFLNQAMRLKAGRNINARNGALLIHVNAPLRFVDDERCPRVARLRHQLIGLPKRAQNIFQPRALRSAFGRIVRTSDSLGVENSLSLLIAQLGC